MKTRQAIVKKLSAAIQNHAVTVPELCASLGINAIDRTASALFDEIVTRYMAARGIA